MAPTTGNPDHDVVDLVADIATLVGVESPSADRDAVRRSADAVRELGDRLVGEPGEVVEVDGVAHVRWRLGHGARRVLVLGHHDTVWPCGTLESLPFTVDDGVMRGPGCFDMKAGLVLAMHATASLARRRGRHHVDGLTLLVTGDEEVGSPTSRALIEEEAVGCRAVLVTEPGLADGSVKVARKGGAAYRLVAHGRGAHAGLDPESGINATVELARQIPAVVALARPERETTVTPTLLAGGTTSNTVPDRAEVAVDVRATSVAEQRRVDRDLRGLVPFLPGARLELVGSINRPPLDRGMADPLADLLDEVCDRMGRPRPGRAIVGGGSDGNFTAAMGIPTLDGLGAVGAGAHARDEHVVVAELAPRREQLAGLLDRLLTEHADHPDPVS